MGYVMTDGPLPGRDSTVFSERGPNSRSRVAGKTSSEVPNLGANPAQKRTRFRTGCEQFRTGHMTT
ncbi:hypothetical protein GYMLUDRAFT_41732 [Collybiopsis luxurians FD-317 M1]|uniref:Uncharacterized protein n=1 Tax=Collybiopsis luxurians FD-317 M1 TaxID=944289 RepID=A0A0D0C3X2_9AGAR|nr:hypothetical protein GYMLUDRAFT_41732 [Collybiopsis luxurians FD-317 M1]